MADRNDPMNDQAIDRALREALDVSPSPDFVARVRMRIANEPAPRSLWNRWPVWAPVAGAVVTAAIVVAVVVGSTRKIGTDVRPGPDGPAADVRLTPPPVASGFSRTETPAMPSTPTPAAATPPHIVRTTSSETRRPTEPEVLIPRAEIEMYRRLIARSRAFDAAALVEGPPDTVADLQPPPELTIDPIRIDPIIPQLSGEGARP